MRKANTATGPWPLIQRTESRDQRSGLFRLREVPKRAADLWLLTSAL